ncbi:hypothetical protein QF034_002123 [Streptomyces africanus]|uniref:Uncharacterized protein n=1 Tax=Streptomyces africanus TaxID=231024 RepID=A0ABU0QKI6_9ACTN|nr:hypothetical protein [Streptomyces africanus]MDQ0747892.1 hypothetical protein [Streptomyces africanus]
MAFSRRMAALSAVVLSPLGNRLLTQETGEFANVEERGRDPRTGRPFTDADRLLTMFLERQNPDADEELTGLVGGAGGTPRQIRRRQALPLHEDPAAKRGIVDSAASSGPWAPASPRWAPGTRRSWRWRWSPASPSSRATRAAPPPTASAS